MATAGDLITRSLRMLGVVDDATGSVASTTQLANGLTALQSLIDTLNAQKITVPSMQTLSLTSTGATTYTFGSGGTFSATRLPRVTGARIRVGGVDYGMEIWSLDKYAAYPLKTTTQTFPVGVYYDQAFPLATAYFLPIPSSGNVLYVDGWTPNTTYAATSTTTVFPPAYDRYFAFQLAIDLAPEYGTQTTASMQDAARESKMALAMNNLRAPLLRPDRVIPPTGRSLNWRTGEPW